MRPSPPPSGVAAVLLLLVGCSDYGVIGSKPDPVAEPELLVEPVLLDVVSCGASRHTVTLESAGSAAVSITALRVEGDGWALITAEWPETLSPGDTLALTVEALPDGIGGDATLVVEHTGGTLTVPLSAAADGPPTATIADPVDGAVLASGVPLELSATVFDAEDAAASLLVTWESDVDGAIAAPVPAADGAVAHAWPAADRTAGPHLLTLTVTDSCGQTASDTATICQDEGYTVDELDLSSWNLEGVAAWNETDGVVELTPASTNVVGTAFAVDETVPGDEVEIRFGFWIGDGSGADGLSLTVLDSTRATTFLGGSGCGMGYGGDASCTDGPALPGWSLEVDTHYNEGQDPTADDHLMLTFDGDVDDPAVWVPLPEMEDTGWHELVVTVSAPDVVVEIDGVVYIDQAVDGFLPFPGWVGFTAGTGSLTNRHRIESLEVTARTCE